MAPPNPHDAFFRAVFRVPRYAAGLLRIALPPGLRALLDLDRVEVLDASHVSPALRGAASDLVVQVARRAAEAPPALVVFAVEHQSVDERFMALRQFTYVAEQSRQWLRNHPGATHLPPIVPVVVHTGDTPWRSPVGFQALVDLGDAPEDALLRPYVPVFEFVLLDLAVAPTESLRPGVEEVSETALEILQVGPRAEAVTRFDAWVERLAPLRAEAGGASTLAAILCYLLYVSPVPTDRVVRAADALPASMKEEIVTGAQQLIEQGRQEGLQKGRQEALAATLLRLAQRRFGEVPAETTARIEGAVAPDLERWLEGLLTAERLNDLFG